jgi:catechol 2,3-dioxygenase-like lactoylglutathione lyase family enzyme
MKCTGVLLYVRDIDVSIGFYVDVLQLTETYRQGSEIAIVVAQGFEFYLHKDPSPVPEHLLPIAGSGRRGIGAIVHLSHDSVTDCIKHLNSKNYPISMGPIDQPFGRRQIYLYDPDGYNIVVEEVI